MDDYRNTVTCMKCHHDFLEPKTPSVDEVRHACPHCGFVGTFGTTTWPDGDGGSVFGYILEDDEHQG